MISKDDAIEIGDTAMNRDPRKYPFGYFSGGSFVLDSTRVFMWFASKEELIKHIAECDPVIHDLDEAEAVAFTHEVAQIFNGNVDLSHENLEKLNSIAKSFLCVEWWGTFDELVRGPSELAKDVRLSLRDDESDSPVLESEMDDFIELIQNYGF